MAAPQFYVYRSTTDKLNDAFARIGDAGDEIVPPLYHLGSRDWLVLVRKGRPLPEPAPETSLSSVDFAGRMRRAAAEGARKGGGDR